MRQAKTLYIIADGGRVRYIENTDRGHFSTFRKFVSAHIHEKSSGLARDKPARVQESAAPARHAIAARLDPRDKVETAFIQSIAEDLSHDGTLDSFDSLVLVAPARLQKVFCESLPPALRAKLVRCIDKDLTKVPDGELDRHLPELLVSRAAT